MELDMEQIPGVREQQTISVTLQKETTFIFTPV